MTNRDATDAPARRKGRALVERFDDFVLRCCGRALRGVAKGRLQITMPSGRSQTFGPGGGPDAGLSLATYDVFWKSLWRGSIGFADAWMAKSIDTRDLGDMFRFFLENKAPLKAAWAGAFRVRLPDKLFHFARRNTRAGSRRNIAAHYDLGNDFYAAWLDRSMTYSSALYLSSQFTLEDAQQAKLDAIVAALDLEPGMRVLEIGCGWGALAERLGRAGATVTAITVSPAQHAFATNRIRAAGLSDRVSIVFQDYRDIAGAFDRIVSIEMIEAVGEDNWDVYFGVIAQHLAPGGSAILQAITIADDAFDVYRRKADFIQRYIFPGGALPTHQLMDARAMAAGLTAEPAVLTFAASYVATLIEWRRRFEAAWPTLSSQGFDERFRRMWLYYLTYCEVGFEKRTIDVGLYRYRRLGAPVAVKN